MQGAAAPLCGDVIFSGVIQMNSARLKRLQAAGWKVGSTRDFLKLSDEEATLVELKLSLTDALKQARQKRHLSQIDLAQRMGSSQSRVAKIEAGDPSVSLDLIVRAFLATGATRQELQRAFSAKEKIAA
jgi:ribosome-binding protein aMBF1 (putative translation factor)